MLSFFGLSLRTPGRSPSDALKTRGLGDFHCDTWKLSHWSDPRFVPEVLACDLAAVLAGQDGKMPPGTSEPTMRF